LKSWARSAGGSAVANLIRSTEASIEMWKRLNPSAIVELVPGAFETWIRMQLRADAAKLLEASQRSLRFLGEAKFGRPLGDAVIKASIIWDGVDASRKFYRMFLEKLPPRALLLPMDAGDAKEAILRLDDLARETMVRFTMIKKYLKPLGHTLRAAARFNEISGKNMADFFRVVPGRMRSNDVWFSVSNEQLDVIGKRFIVTIQIRKDLRPVWDAVKNDQEFRTELKTAVTTMPKSAYVGLFKQFARNLKPATFVKNLWKGIRLPTTATLRAAFGKNTAVLNRVKGIAAIGGKIFAWKMLADFVKGRDRKSLPLSLILPGPISILTGVIGMFKGLFGRRGRKTPWREVLRQKGITQAQVDVKRADLTQKMKAARVARAPVFGKSVEEILNNPKLTNKENAGVNLQIFRELNREVVGLQRARLRRQPGGRTINFPGGRFGGRIAALQRRIRG